MKFIVTVGVQYRPSGTHHLAGPYVHPDGWLEVEADSESAAREMVVGALGRQWAFIYPREDHDPAPYPLGRTGAIDRCVSCGQMCVVHPVTGECAWCRAAAKMELRARGIVA